MEIAWENLVATMLGVVSYAAGLAAVVAFAHWLTEGRAKRRDRIALEAKLEIDVLRTRYNIEYATALRDLDNKKIALLSQKTSADVEIERAQARKAEALRDQQRAQAELLLKCFEEPELAARFNVRIDDDTPTPGELRDMLED